MTLAPSHLRYFALAVAIMLFAATDAQAQNPTPYCNNAELKQLPHMYDAPIFQAYVITHFPSHPEFEYPSPANTYMLFCTFDDCEKFRLSHYKEAHSPNGAWVEFVCR
jgi:hypothetical protein